LRRKEFKPIVKIMISDANPLYIMRAKENGEEFIYSAYEKDGKYTKITKAYLRATERGVPYFKKDNARVYFDAHRIEKLK
jgi:hypothetical protein